MKKKVLVVMTGRPMEYMGGQERRWARVVSYGSMDPQLSLIILINKSYYDLLGRSEIDLNARNLVIVKDWRNRFLDILWKNLVTLWNALKCDVIHLTTQGMSAYPAAMLIKILLGRRFIFSYTGVSIDCFENNDVTRNFAKRVKKISRIADITEVLNEVILAENWPSPAQLSRAPCSFSDPTQFMPRNKIPIIVWAGHLIDGKGTDLLKKFLLYNSEKKYKVAIYGSAIDDERSRKFEAWLQSFKGGKEWLSISRPDNMTEAYSQAWIVLSLQKVSNYPSQVVLEALLSGCQVIMTDTGDSHLFDCPDVIHFISKDASAADIGAAIENAFTRQENQFVKQARDYVLKNHTVENYFDHLKSIWLGA